MKGATGRLCVIVNDSSASQRMELKQHRGWCRRVSVQTDNRLWDAWGVWPLIAKLQYRVSVPVKYLVGIAHSGIQDVHSQERVFLLLHTKAVQHRVTSLQKERASMGNTPMAVIPRARVNGPY